MLLVACREEERQAPFTRSGSQAGHVLWPVGELLKVAAAELLEASWVVPEPVAQFVARSELLGPFVEPRGLP